jgi:hypothetical protein
MKEIEEYLFLNKIKTREDFKPWFENAKRSLIQQNRNYRVIIIKSFRLLL